MELADAHSKIVQMKDTLTKVLSANPDSINTASMKTLEEDQSYFDSYSSIGIHYEMLKVKTNYCFLDCCKLKVRL